MELGVAETAAGETRAAMVLEAMEEMGAVLVEVAEAVAEMAAVQEEMVEAVAAEAAELFAESGKEMFHKSEPYTQTLLASVPPHNRKRSSRR